MASPPKPWERAGSVPSAASTFASGATTDLTPRTAPTSTATAASPAAAAAASSSTSPPAIPERPSSLSANRVPTTTALSRPGVGVSPYNTYGGYGSAYSSPYASPYSRLGGYGGYGGGMYGGMGGYGGMYGGGMYGGMGGMPGMMQDPNNPNSLTNQFNNSTQATFQLLEGLVGAFTGFAQMLESTYMTTHSSFFAMVAVAEQFSNLRTTLGNLLGIFALMRWLRTLVAKLTGRPPPADATALNPIAFAKFEGRKLTAGPDGSPSAAPKPSRKPLLFFLAAAFGLPYLMNKVIKSLAASQEQQQQQAMAMASPAGGAGTAFDPSKLEFCRVMWDYQPENQPAGAAEGLDLAVRKGDLVAVLSKSDPLGNSSEWWRCRARNGKTGYVPSAYLEVVTRGGAQQGRAAIAAAPAPAVVSAPGGGAKVPPASSSAEAVGAGAGKGGVVGKELVQPKPVTAESVAKSQFFS